jgi:hypothetical protein
MKRIVVILTLAFITCFAGTSQAHGWGRWWGWGHRCWAPRPCVVVRAACYHPVWYPGYWAWSGPCRVWVRGYWR